MIGARFLKAIKLQIHMLKKTHKNSTDLNACYVYMMSLFLCSAEPQAPMVDVSALARSGVQARSRFGAVMAPPSGQRLRMRGGRSPAQVSGQRGAWGDTAIFVCVLYSVNLKIYVSFLTAVCETLEYEAAACCVEYDSFLRNI